MKPLDPDEALGVFLVLQGILWTALLRLIAHALKSSVPQLHDVHFPPEQKFLQLISIARSDIYTNTHIPLSMLHLSSHPFPPPSHELALHQAASAAS